MQKNTDLTVLPFWVLDLVIYLDFVIWNLSFGFSIWFFPLTRVYSIFHKIT